MIVLVVIMSILGTGAIFGLCYMFYEIIKDMTYKEPEQIKEVPASSKLKFKKPKL
jgi:hypothetical protein